MIYYNSDETRAAYGWHKRKPYGTDIHCTKKRSAQMSQQEYPKLPLSWKKY